MPKRHGDIRQTSGATALRGLLRKVAQEGTTPLDSGLPEELSFENGHLKNILGRAVVSVATPPPAKGLEPPSTVESISLPEAIQVTLGFSREVKAAQARVDLADSQLNQARALLRPNVTFKKGYGREISAPGSTTDPATTKPYVRHEHNRSDQSLSLRQPLYDAQSFRDWKRRDLIVDSRTASLRSTETDAYLSTVDAYLGMASSRLMSELSRVYERQLEQLLDYITQRAAAGASSESDMQRVRARTLTARSSRLEQDAANAAAVVEFVRLTNVVPKTLLLPKRDEIGSVTPESFEANLQKVLEQNHELRALQLDLEAADRDIHVAKARYLPRLDLELSDQRTNNAGGPTGLQHDQRAMVVFNMNLYAGHADFYLIKEKEARRDELRWRADDLRRRLSQDIATQYATLESTRLRLVSGYKEWTAIASAARSVSERMLSGNQSLMDVMDVVDRTYQARSKLVNLHIQEIAAMARIQHLLGQTNAEAVAKDAVVSPPAGKTSMNEAVPTSEAQLHG